MLKPYKPLLILFVIVNASVLVWKGRLGNVGIKYEVVTVANILLFLFTLISLLLQVKAASNKNPNAIVRAVMAGMGMKLIGFATAVLIYISIAGKEKSNPSVYVCLGLYLIYMWLEVRLFLKQNPKRMPKSEHPLHTLTEFLPDGSFEQVALYIQRYRVHLTITRKRKSVLGDYRHAGIGKNHRITVNGDLNKYEFLITFLHELAHLLTFEQYRNRVEAHGIEWKNSYSALLIEFVNMGVFPADIVAALRGSIMNPAATANGETALLLVLRKYNTKQNGLIPVAEIPAGRLFQTENGRVFMKGLLRRKRFECVEVKSGLRYSFSAVTEVRLLEI